MAEVLFVWRVSAFFDDFYFFSHPKVLEVAVVAIAEMFYKSLKHF